MLRSALASVIVALRSTAVPIERDVATFTDSASSFLNIAISIADEPNLLVTSLELRKQRREQWSELGEPLCQQPLVAQVPSDYRSYRLFLLKGRSHNFY